MTKEYNAVFKGGGAKGIAYAGALLACEEQGIEFPEVAGSSAGAITATLVACGYTATEIIEQMPKALESIGNVRKSLMAIASRPSLLANDDLHKWLAGAIGFAKKVSDKVDGKPGEKVTFLDIERATGKKLYVVTLDLATRQPRVFSPDLTPDSPVAAAVVASSAIPVAFPSARMLVTGDVHRLVDGGTWSNYPAFVFHDEGFRHCHDLPETNRPTLGFILDDEEAPTAEWTKSSPTPNARGRLMGDKGSSTEQLKFPGAVISSPMFRWLAALLPLMFMVLSMMWVHDEIRRPDPWIARLNESTQELVLVVVVAIFALTGLLALAISFVVIRLGRSLFDSGAVGAIAAIGVGPSVAYWVGQGRDDDHVAVRIRVPAKLKTLNFEPDAETRAAALAAGYIATRTALAAVPDFGELKSRVPLITMVSPAQRPPRPTGVRLPWWSVKVVARPVFAWVKRPVKAVGEFIVSEVWRRVVATGVALLVATTAAFAAFESFDRGSGWIALCWLVVVGIAMLLGASLLAYDRYLEATQITPYTRLGERSVGQLRAIGYTSLALTALTLLSALSLGEASFVTASQGAPVNGTLLVVEEVDDRWEVEVEIVDEDLAATLLGADVLEALSKVGLESAGLVDDDAFDDFLDRLFERPFRDLYGDEVPILETTDSTTSFVLMTDEEPDVMVNGPIALRADLERDRLFLEQDIWDVGRGQATIQLLVVLGLFFLGIGLRGIARRQLGSPAATGHHRRPSRPEPAHRTESSRPCLTSRNRRLLCPRIHRGVTTGEVVPGAIPS